MKYEDFVRSFVGAFQLKNILVGSIVGLFSYMLISSITDNPIYIFFVAGFGWIAATTGYYLFLEISQSEHSSENFGTNVRDVHAMKIAQTIERLIQLNQFIRMNGVFNSMQIDQIEEIIDVGIQVTSKASKLFPGHSTTFAICHFLAFHLPSQVRKYALITRDFHFQERHELFNSVIRNICDELRECERLLDIPSEEGYAQKCEMFTLQYMGARQGQYFQKLNNKGGLPFVP